MAGGLSGSRHEEGLWGRYDLAIIYRHLVCALRMSMRLFLGTCEPVDTFRFLTAHSK